MTVYKYNRNNICWQKVEGLVFQWQCKIYQASISGNKNQIYFIQSKLIRSTIRKLIAIRRGINNFEKQKTKSQYIYFFSYDKNFETFIKSTIYKEKIKKVHCLCIFSIINSYTLLLINLALEPEWERRFSKYDQNRYKFRIRFQYHDIIENVRKQIRNPTYFISIKASKINIFGYILILKKIHINPQNYNLFRNWFKEVFFKKDEKSLRRTNKTIYQKNTECFFFKNIVICGIEIFFIERISKKIKFLRNFHISRWIKNFGYARFDNNFVVLSPSRNRKRLVIEISKWLLKVGLNLKKKRFKMCHSRKKIRFPSKKIIKNIIFPGFNICGFFFNTVSLGKLHVSRKIRS